MQPARLTIRRVAEVMIPREDENHQGVTHVNCGREEWEHLIEGCGCESWVDCACSATVAEHVFHTGCPQVK